MATLEALTGVLSYQFDDAGLKKAQAELAATSRANSELTESQKAAAEWSEKYSAKLGAVAVASGTMAAAGGVATAAILDSVSAAKEYEASLAQVATLSPEAAAKTGEYKQQILEVSTALGTNAVDSANALYDALSSGVPPENAVSFMATASKAAVAGATDTGTAVTGLNAVINAWGLNAADAAKVGDVFFQGVNLGVMRFEDLAGSIGQVAPLAASLGVDFEQVSAATAKLTKGGLTAAQAITQQRAAMVALITPNKDMAAILDDVAAGNDEVARYAEENGVSTGKAMLATLGFQGSLEAVRASAEGTGANLEKALGSVEAIGGVFGLTGENAAEARQFLDAMNGSAGQTEAAFAKMAETTDFKWKQMQAAFENTRIALGQALLPVVSAALDILKPLADAALAGAQAFGQLPTPVKAAGVALVLAGTGITTFVAVLAGLGAAFGPGLVAMATMATGTATLGAAWGVASTAIVASAGAALAAIAPLLPIGIALGAVVLSLKKGHDDFAASLDKSYQAAKLAGGGLEAYRQATQRAKEETSGIGKVWSQLSSNEGLDLQSSTRAWLQYGVGVDQAILKTDSFKQAQQAAGEEWRKTGDVEAYKNHMLAAADAASVAAGKGHLLTEEQKRQAEAFAKATSALLDKAGPMASALAQDDEFIAKQKELATAVTDGAKTQQQALVEMNGYIAKRGEQAAADQAAAKAAADAASANDTLKQSYSGQFAADFGAGSKAGLSEEDKAKAQEDADKALVTSAQDSLSQIWKLRQEHDAKMKEARAADAADAQRAAAARARAAEDGANKSNLAEMKFADKIADLNTRMAKQKTDEGRAAVQRDIDIANAAHAQREASERGHQGQLTGIVSSEGGKRTQEVQKEYDQQVAAAKEALAQTAVEYVKSQVLLGNTSEATAKTIFSELKKSFPGVEIISPVEEATLHFNALLHQAAAGSVDAMGQLSGSINGVDAAMQATSARGDEMAASWGASTDNLINKQNEEREAADRAAAGIVESNRAAGNSAQERHQISTGAMQGESEAYGRAAASAAETGQAILGQHASVGLSAQQRHQISSGAMQGERDEYRQTATTAKTESDKTAASLDSIGGAAKTTAGQVSGSMGTVRSEVASLPGAMSKAAGDTQAQAAAIGRAFGVSGEQARAYTREAKGAMDDAAAGAAAATKETQTYGGTSADAHKNIAAGAKTSTSAVKDHGGTAVEQYGAASRGAKEYGEETKRLNDIIKQLPKDIRVQMTLVGADKFKQTVLEILADLRNIPEVKTVTIRGKYEGTGTMEEGHSLQLQHDIENIYAVVEENGPIVLTGLFDGGVVTEKLPWQIAVENFNAALADSEDFMGQWEQRAQTAFGPGGLWDFIQQQWLDKNAPGGAMTPESLQALINSGDITPPDWRLLTGSPEEAKAEWKRFWDEVKAVEDERHTKARYNLEWERDHHYKSNEGMKEILDRQIDQEDQRHNAIMANYEVEMSSAERFWTRADAFEKRRAEALKLAQDAIKDRQKTEVDAENSAYSMTMEHIEDEVRLRKEAHDTILADIDERKRIEAEAYAASTKALDEQARLIKEQGDERARELSHYKDQIEQQKIDLDISGAKDKLEELKKDASAFSSIMGKLEDTKKVDADDEKRRKERVKLHTDAQREMLRKYGDMVAEEDQRTVGLLLAGYEVRGSEADRVMAQINARLGDSVKGQEGVVSAREQEAKQLDELLRQADAKAKTEKEADDAKLRAIDEIKRKAQDAHTEYVRQIDLEKRQEDERYKAEAAAIASLKEAEKDRHEAEVKRINEQYALELLKLGKSEEEVQAILAERADAAKRISDEADRRYKEAIAAVEAESKRLQGEQKAHEDDVRGRVNAMYRDLIERMRAIAQAIGGEAGKAIDDMLAKLLNEQTGLPAVEAAWVRIGKSIAEASKAAQVYKKSIGEAYTEEDAERAKQRDEQRAKGHWDVPKERLNQTSKRGAGGFRAGHDWVFWHGKWVPDTIAEDEDPAGAGAATPPPATNPPGSGRKTLPIEPPTNTGKRPGHGIEPDPWRYGMDPGHGIEPDPWRYGMDPGHGAEPDPWRYAKEAGDAMLNNFINPVNDGLATMQERLAAIGVALGGIAPSYTAFGGGGTKIDYHHYGDNVFVGDDAAQDFLVGLHMAP